MFFFQLSTNPVNQPKPAMFLYLIAAPGPLGFYKIQESIKRVFANTWSCFSEKRTHFLKKQEESTRNLLFFFKHPLRVLTFLCISLFVVKHCVSLVVISAVQISILLLFMAAVYVRSTLKLKLQFINLFNPFYLTRLQSFYSLIYSGQDGIRSQSYKNGTNTY